MKNENVVEVRHVGGSVRIKRENPSRYIIPITPPAKGCAMFEAQNPPQRKKPKKFVKLWHGEKLKTVSF